MGCIIKISLTLRSVFMADYTRFAHFVLCALGVGIAFYSIHVESMLVNIPGYAPACDISSWAMSCSKVFNSEYAKPLSHWGLVAKRSFFDLSLPQLALLYFVPLMAFPRLFKMAPRVGSIFRTLSYLAIGFNLYLAYILKFVLGEVCIVCVSNYIVNLGLWMTVNRIASSLPKKPSGAKKQN